MTQDIQIYIDNFRVDIGTTSAIQIKKQFKDVKEFSKRKTSFSKPINVLYTKNNASIFGAAFNINEVGGWDRNSKPTARLVVNGVEMPVTNAKLDSFGGGGYSFVLYKDEVNLTSIFGDELIRGNADASKDISFTNQYSFNYTRPNLRALLQSSPRSDGLGINYAYADVIESIDPSIDYEKDRILIPSIAAKELLEETLLSVGKTITFSPEELTYLNKIYIPFNGPISEISNRWDFSKHTAKEASLTIGSSSIDKFGFRSVARFFTNYDKIRDETNVEALEYFLMGQRRHIGNYEIKLKLNIGYSIPGSQIEREIKPHIIVYNFDTQEANELTLINTTSVNTDDNLIIPALISSGEDTFVGNFSLQAPNELAVYVMYEEIKYNTGYPGVVNISGLTTVEIAKLDSLYNEDTPNVITADKILPYNYKKIDLFNDITGIFNSRITSEDDNISTQTANEFNNDDAKVFRDWSDIIDESSINLSTLLSQKSEIINYKMGESDDTFSDDYKNQFDSGISDIKNISTTKKIVENNIVFANTIRNNLYSSLIHTDDYNSLELAPRLLFVNASLAGTLKFGIDDSGSRDRSIVNLHILSNRFSEDRSAANNLILAFKNEFSYSTDSVSRLDTNGTIYNRFYKGEENLMLNDDAILLTANFKLSDKDFGEVNFNDVIFIKTKRHGSAYYRLNEITGHYIGSNKLSKVELIKIDLENLNYEFSASEINLMQIYLQNNT